MPNVARGRDHQIARRVGDGMEGGGNGPIKRRDGLLSSFNWPPQGMPGEVSRMEEFIKQFVGSVSDHLHLFDDYSLLKREIVRIEAWIGQHVGEQIEGLRHSVVDDLQGESSDFMRGISVQVSPQTVGFGSDLSR